MDANLKTLVTVDGIEYALEAMSQQQQMLLKHVADLDGKLDMALFSADQLRVGRDAFFAMLKSSLEATSSEKPAGMAETSVSEPDPVAVQPTVSAGMADNAVSEPTPATIQPTVGPGAAETSVSGPDPVATQPTVPAPTTAGSEVAVPLEKPPITRPWMTP